MTSAASPSRRSECARTTAETAISGSLVIDGSGKASIKTGVGFLDHMLTALACHSGMDLTLECTGDLAVDDHHTVEDCAIVLGTLLNDGLGDRRAINRFGHAYAPLDESLARAVIDLATRPSATIDLGLRREKLGELSCENASHFFATLSSYGRFCLHLDVLRGVNDHHRLEAAFKAFALALKHAVRATSAATHASTKGVL
jgi:imidazoleglycerol phosphate dehydratase HisB